MSTTNQTNVSFRTLEGILSENPSFVPAQWTKLYDIFYNEGNRAAVTFVVRQFKSQKVSQPVADAVALLRRRLDGE